MNGWKLQTSLFYDSSDYKVRAGAADIEWGNLCYSAHIPPSTDRVVPVT